MIEALYFYVTVLTEKLDTQAIVIVINDKKEFCREKHTSSLLRRLVTVAGFSDYITKSV